VCPDDLVEGYCTLLESFNAESPTGELDVEAERWDEQRLREKEARFRHGGRHETTTVALAPDGEVVGMTEVMVSEHAPDRGFQGATIVKPSHRGHRLGLRLKVTNQRLVREAFPGCRTLLTGNADVNAAMNAVNERLGYRSVERVHEMQKRLGTR
jgi:GNAT superfamily N-acetyltransferase